MESNQQKDKLFVIKDLITGEVLMDNIGFFDIQESLNMVTEQQRIKGARQDRPVFCLHIK